MVFYYSNRIWTHPHPLDLGFPNFILYTKGRTWLPLDDVPRLHAMPILPHVALDLEYFVDRLSP